MAAANALQALGYQVVVPEQSLCCGRPLYDFGFLDKARKLLHDIWTSSRTTSSRAPRRGRGAELRRHLP